MSMPIKPIVLIVALFASLSSQTQGLMLGFESNITLKQDDIELIHQTVDQKINVKPVGTTASWSNPNTGNSGTIKLLKKHTVRGLRCEKGRIYANDNDERRAPGALRARQLSTAGRDLENLVTLCR